ncbi:ABC transporter permease [Clostridium tagluense]|uniref:ABC transporter permease n=1 Tax=Clostridium tagluense TaxID=360422 RepID=UPI001CF236DD|nr:FtsX-like permease family protein [Clostridium tagluense]MCB2300041.1 FtsX-like permease family protein [Clostridium tagluense]
MYFKLVYKNVKKSFRDYLIYFITLTFSVAMFFTFNSLDSQAGFVEIQSSQQEILHVLENMLGIISVFISVVIGFLVIYANNFLIKRRKNEFGIYGSLGMGRNDISMMLLMETLLIGIIAMFLGVILGIFASKGLQAVAIEMFRGDKSLDLSKYKFVFSWSALRKTAICFASIFACVAVFNIKIIKKNKLINLLYEVKSNKTKFLSAKAGFLAFTLSLIMLVISYAIILNIGLAPKNKLFFVSLVCGVIGTYLFFLSMGSFITECLRKVDKLYLKNINLFTIRQIGNKVSKNVISLTIITLMLFLTITILSSGIGVNKAIIGNSKFGQPFDVTIFGLTNKKAALEIINNKKTVIKKDIKESYAYEVYESGIQIKSLMSDEYLSGLTKVDMKLLNTQHQIAVIKLSDYNNLTFMEAGEKLQLDDKSYTICSNNKVVVNGLQGKATTISINGKQFQAEKKECLYRNFSNINDAASTAMIILADDQVKNFNASMGGLVINTFKDLDIAVIDSYDKELLNHGAYIASYRVMRQIGNLTTSMLASFVGIYVGIIFLVSSGAVLAIQELSEASDSKRRYEMLRKLGVGRKQVNNSILVQILVYFLVPFAMAFLHSCIALKVIGKLIKQMGTTNMMTNIIIVSAIVCCIYGVYLLLTYAGAKKMNK